MKHFLTLLIVTLAAVGVISTAQTNPARPGVQPAIRLYVAPDGNDTSDGSTRAPLASLEGARQKIAALKNNGALPRGGVEVIVRGGTYCLADTFRLEAADSGTVGAPIVYRAAQGEKAQLSGGKPITGFVPHRGAILKANVAAQGLKGVYFRQLFFDGQRQILARYPNFDPRNPTRGGWAYVAGKIISMYKEAPGEDKRTLPYQAADARPWSRPSDGEVFIFPRYNWWNNIVPIAMIDREKRTITLAEDASYTIRPGDRYYVQNIFEELDAPGEWYLDRAAGTLYFWPPSPLEGRPVYAPVLRTLIALGPGTSHVTIRGFDLQCCAGTAVELTRAEDCLIAGNTIHNAGDYAGSGVAVEGGRRNGVAGNDIFEVGSHGISLSGGERKTLTPAENYANNNVIHHIGVFFKQGVGVNLTGVGNRASHNLIYDLPRMGIMFQGNNLVMEYNHIHHASLETDDTAAIYTPGRDWISSRGTVIRYNFIHDVIGFGQQAWGIYYDNNACGIDAIGNIVARAPTGLIMMGNAHDNHFENNILVGAVTPQIILNGWQATTSIWPQYLGGLVRGYQSVAGLPAWRGLRGMDIDPAKSVFVDNLTMHGNLFERNIFYYDDPKTPPHSIFYRDKMGSRLFRLRSLPLDLNHFDYNLVYHFGKPLDLDLYPFYPAGTAAARAAQKKLPIDTPTDHWPRWWQAQGQDQHSVVADPLFVDPAKDDYRLKPGSPAFKLGFKPIPVEKIGPYKSELRANWPVVETD